MPAHIALPTVADIASHHPLHDTIPFADHPAWTKLCETVIEEYRQASAADDWDRMAKALVDVLELLGKYLYKQRVHTHARIGIAYWVNPDGSHARTAVAYSARANALVLTGEGGVGAYNEAHPDAPVVEVVSSSVAVDRRRRPSPQPVHPGCSSTWCVE